MAKHKPEVNPRAADEIALAGGCVEKPVGLQDEVTPGRQGVFDSDEGGEGFFCITIRKTVFYLNV